MSRIQNEYVDNFPLWALYFAVYGEDDTLTDEERNMVSGYMERFMKDMNWRYIIIEMESCEVSFCSHPVFGLPCECIEVCISGERTK